MDAGDSMPATDTVFCGLGWCIGNWPCQFSRNAGFWGSGYGCNGGALLAAGVEVLGDTADGPVGGLGPPGGSLTTGLDASSRPPCRETMEPAGDTSESRPISRANEDLLLIATLGE